MKKLLIGGIVCGVLIIGLGVLYYKYSSKKELSFGAPTQIFQRTIIPETNNLYDLGSSASSWRNIYASGTIFGDGSRLTGTNNINNKCFTVTDGVTTSTLCANSLNISTSTANLLGLFNVDSSGNVSASGTFKSFSSVTTTGILYASGGFISSASSTVSSNLNVTGNLSVSSTLQTGGQTTIGGNLIPSSDNIDTLGGISNRWSILDTVLLRGSYSASNNLGLFYVDGSGNVSTSGTLAVNGASNGSVTSTIATSLNVGSDSIIYDASTTQTGVTSLLTGPQTFDNDAGAVSWVDAPITTTTANIEDSYCASVGGQCLLKVFGLTDTSGGTSLTSAGIIIAPSSSTISQVPYAAFDVNNVMTVSSSTGNISTSGTLAVLGTTTSTFAGAVSTTLLQLSNLTAAPTAINPVCVDASGYTFVGSSSICPLSSLDSKTGLKPISYGLAEILKTDFFDFQLKNNDGRTHEGPVADYTDKYMPNLTEWRNGKINGFDYLSMIGVEGQAIKDLNAKVDKLQTQVNDLSSRTSLLERIFRFIASLFR